MRALVAAGLSVIMEGQNESNNTQALGTVATPPAAAAAAQQAIWAAAHPLGIMVISPSIALLRGLRPASFVRDYFGGLLPAVSACCDVANSHNYPNNGGPAHELAVRTRGVAAQFGKPRVATTETHPNLWNRNLDATLGAAWNAIGKLTSTFDFDAPGWFWFCMWDYAGAGFPAPVGLFKGYDPTRPSQSALLMQALFAICGDLGSTAATFAPRTLDVTATGLPTGINHYGGGHVRVMERSDGVRFVALTNEQDTWGTDTSVTVTLGATPSKVVLYKPFSPILGAASPAQTWTDGSTTFPLTLKAPDVQVLEIHDR